MMLNTSSDIDEVVASFMLAIQDSTKAETQGSEMTTIYFDESGNTGRQLADLDQPLFILGSCDFSAEECEQLLRPLRSRQAPEIHFKKLRKTGRGQDRVIELFRSDLVTPERFKAQVFHKRFMLLTKVIDDLLEPLLFYQFDFNIYENGQNIALSNMLFACLPLAVGDACFDQFLSLYYDMCGEKSEEAITAFYEHLEVMKEAAAQSTLPMEWELEMLSMTSVIVRDALEDLPKSTFNPAIPAFFSLCVEWGRQHARFDAICDDSEPLERQADFFKAIAELEEQAEEQQVIGFGNAQIELPLRLNTLAFSASHDSDGIQLTDVLTSALSYYYTKRQKGETDDEFFMKLDSLGFLHDFVSGCVWPTTDVTPEALGRAGDEGGHNPANAFADFMMARDRQA
ncbi:hypothetical protein PSYJA_16512 [Pseudomonas syringae pv. japonica str. M301072]|uniref:DUF3800 domain-containing protein n=1 Tax=Pseudomonas syringae pv. japonica str. M301072 TaxID=629262 RepID=F3FJV1_PSESX|nr:MULTISPECIES: DUF3800 domain-containing protein [Pseudomonas syringae group]EGH30487.1 hypothetical protein PSYJA_16512 [Pseudomonas syringae pv. japonica str. M301072]KPW34703.1 Uncharacterized protein ALO87_00036 [Pseudomonas syringae pv. apii]